MPRSRGGGFGTTLVGETRRSWCLSPMHRGAEIYGPCEHSARRGRDWFPVWACAQTESAMSPLPTRFRALFLLAFAGLAAWAHAVPTIDLQPQITVTATSGQPAAFSVQASGTGTVRYQWRRMGGDLSGKTGADFTIPAATVADSGYYDVVVTDDTGSVTSTPSRLIVAPKNGYPDTLRLDTSFAPLLENEGARMNALTMTSDGGGYLSGYYMTIGGQRRTGLVHFNPDLTIDSGFVSAVATAQQIVVQPDGKLLVNLSNRVCRLNADGSLDSSFSAAFSNSGYPGSVSEIALQADGKLLVRGYFTSVNGIARSQVARLNSNGSLDQSFDVALGQNDTAYAIKLVGPRVALLGGFYETGGTRYQMRMLDDAGAVVAATPSTSSQEFSSTPLESDEDGGIYVMRSEYVGGGGVNRLVRYRSDATLDDTFQSDLTSWPSSLSTMKDGRIVALTQPSPGLFQVVVLESNGTIDPSSGFSVSGLSTSFGGLMRVSAVGRIVLTGYSSAVESELHGGLASYDLDGGSVLSLAGDLRQSASASAVLPVADGKWLVSGSFTYLNGEACAGWARLNRDGTVDPSFTTTITPLDIYGKMVLQGDGKILVVRCQGFSVDRLLPDGSADPSFSFSSGAGFVPAPTCVQILPDGRIAAGGSIYGYNGESFRAGCAVLLPDGKRDTSFAISTSGTYGIYAIASDHFGGVALGGNSLRDSSYSSLGSIVRLDRLGGISFPAGTPESLTSVRTMDTDASGRLVLAGDFQRSGSPSRRGFLRMNDDGSIMPAGERPVSFSALRPGLLVQNDDKVLVSGSNAPLIRVGADDSLDPSFCAPDLSGASLGLPSQMAYDDDGRLLMTSASASRDGQGAGPLVMLKPDSMPSVVVVPAISTQPADVVVAVGTSAHLWVEASVERGGLAYQWYEGETGDTSVPISGATLPVFDTPAVSATTQVWVRVSSSTASVDSRTVTISVDPRQAFAQWIAASGAPADQRGELDMPAGDGVTNLMKFALGVPPLDAAGGHLPTPELYAAEGQPVSVALVFARNPNARGIRYALDVSSNLIDWEEVGSAEDGLGLNPDGTELVRLREMSPPTAPRRFLRLKVEAVTP